MPRSFVSRFSTALQLLLLSQYVPDLVQGLKCGIPFVTKDCIGDVDIRYDADKSYDLKENSDFWGNFEGLYSGYAYRYNTSGLPMSRIIEGFPFGVYNLFPTRYFENITVVGTRYIRTTYEVISHASKGPGLVFNVETFWTSTFEKDGSARKFGLFHPRDAANETVQISGDDVKELLVPSSANTAEISVKGIDDVGGVLTPFTLQASINVDETSSARVETYYQYLPDTGKRTLLYMQRFDMTKMDAEATWLAEIDAAVTAANVDALPPSPKLDTVRRPENIETQQCTKPNQALCVSEDTWQENDVNYLESPYVEPDGVLTGAFTAIVVVVAIAIGVLVFYFVNKAMMSKQEKRLKSAFGKAIGQHVKGGISNNVTPDELKKTFQKIDVDENGTISKAELKQIMMDSNGADLSDRDFEILYSSIDIDGDGALSFSEYAAFFASIANDGNTFEDDP